MVYGSEGALPWQRDLIEQAFGCRSFSWYGQTELAVLAAECGIGRCHHVFLEYGITELLDEDGQRVTRPGVPGRVCGTGFHNPAMPLLRYATGDVAAWHDAPCTCGRSYPLLRHIEGRDSEFLVSADGRPLPLLNIPYSRIMVEVSQFQFHQRETGAVRLRIVPLPTYRSHHGAEMKTRLEAELPGTRVDVEVVEEVTRTARGKTPYVVQEVPIPALEAPP